MREYGGYLPLVVKQPREVGAQEVFGGVSLRVALDVNSRQVMVLGHYLGELVLRQDEPLIVRVVVPVGDRLARRHRRKGQDSGPAVVIL